MSHFGLETFSLLNEAFHLAERRDCTGKFFLCIYLVKFFFQVSSITVTKLFNSIYTSCFKQFSKLRSNPFDPEQISHVYPIEYFTFINTACFRNFFATRFRCSFLKQALYGFYSSQR